MSINEVERIDDRVAVRHALVSVSDKTGLETFIPGLLQVNPEMKIFSTGGTYARIGEILQDPAAGRLVPVSDYTGQPETQGGLVKTLDFKIYLGLLTETYNEAHQQDLVRTSAVAIDLVVVNLYPFQQTVAREGVTVEQARGNIDIGGPCMIRASAKNFLRVAPVVDPADYDRVLADLKAGGGSLGAALRFELAKKAFAHTAAYDRAISEYLDGKAEEEMRGCYTFEQ